MASETDIRIARAVALKAAVELVNGKHILLADMEGKAEELTGFLLEVNPARYEVGDPGPQPDEWPDDREAYEPTSNATQGPVGQTPPTCLCGAEKVYTRTDTYTAYFCPNQVKSRDPVVQAEQKIKHPPTWL